MKLFKFFDFIRETFNTKSFQWVRNTDVEHKATFSFLNKTYHVCLDMVGPDCYNLYFYFLNSKGEKVMNLIGDFEKNPFKVFSNVNQVVLDFQKNHPINFLGFSSLEGERDSLYTLFLQKLVQPGYIYSIKPVKNKTYYFLYREDFSFYTDFIMKRFMEHDDTKKLSK